MKNAKINLVFLINDKFINNFESIYNCKKRNKKFNVVVVACESKATSYKEKISSEEIHEYLLSRNIKNIDGYDKKTKKYINLKEFKPDYIFVSNPYDIYRPEEYSSRNLSILAKVCSIEYGAILLKKSDNEIEKNSFFKNCYKYFICAEEEKDIEINKNILDKFYPIGCIKLDKYLYSQKKQSDNWARLFNKKTDKLRIVWKPRWTIDRENLFVDYLDFFSNYIVENNIELLLLEHPLLIENLKSKNIYNLYENHINKMKKLPNFKISKEDNFLDYILFSDVIITEQSSLLVEFSVTNKTAIIIKNECTLNSMAEKLIDYKIASPHELTPILSKIAHKNNFSLKNKRLFRPPHNKTSAEYLFKYIEKDYKNTNNNNDYYKNKLYILNKEIQKINKILTQGFYDNSLNNCDIPLEDISDGLKIWADTITELKIIIEDMHKSKRNK